MVAVLPALIDTTFALHRAGEPFRRLKSALRVYEPYEARHLDWYRVDDRDDYFSLHSDSAISHWNNLAERGRYQSEPLQYTEYTAVRVEGSGSIATYEEQVLHDALPDGSELPVIGRGGVAPFASAAEDERALRIGRTYELSLHAASDISRWREPASYYPDWAARTVALAAFVRAGERVFEFGSGRSALPSALPPECMYTGSDLVPLAPGVIYFDLNAITLPPIVGYDVALFSGVLEYVHDLRRVIEFTVSNFKVVICSYAVMRDESPQEIAKRRYSGWFNDATEHGLVSMFVAAGFTLTGQDLWGAQALFRFEVEGRAPAAVKQ
jgi:hypothetical protein